MRHRLPAISDGIRRILLVRTDRLGDVVLTLPMLPLLRACYPDAIITMLLHRYTGAILEGHPFVDDLLWDDEPGNRLNFWRVLRELRSRHFDVAIVVHPTLRLACLVALAGIPIRIGSGYRYYSILFNRRVYEHRKDAKKHEVEYNIGLLAPLGCQVQTSPEFSITISPEDRRSVEKVLHSLGWNGGEELVILHPGSGGSAREWPAESFAALASRFLAECRMRIIITGTEHDRDKARKIVEATHNSAADLTGQLRLKELAALIDRSSLFISNSTGPLHIAAAVGTAVVGLYPQLIPMSAARWGPYTAKKRVLAPKKPVDCRECNPNRGDPCPCMASITVEEVFEAAVQLLSEDGVVQKGAGLHEQ